MKKHKGSLAKDVRRAFNALAYAHLGEMLSDTTKREIVYGDATGRPKSVASVDVPRMAPVVRRKRVALVIDGRVRPGALRYALSACSRLDADLEVLTNLPQSEIEQAIAHENTEAGQLCQVVPIGADLLTSITEHVRRHINTLFVVTSAADAIADKFVMARPYGKDMQVPWLVVSDDLRAA